MIVEKKTCRLTCCNNTCKEKTWITCTLSVGWNTSFTCAKCGVKNFVECHTISHNPPDILTATYNVSANNGKRYPYKIVKRTTKVPPP